MWVNTLRRSFACVMDTRNREGEHISCKCIWNILDDTLAGVTVVVWISGTIAVHGKTW